MQIWKLHTMSITENLALEAYQNHYNFIFQCVRRKLSGRDFSFTEEDVLQEVWFKFDRMEPGYLDCSEDVARKIIQSLVGNLMVDMIRRDSPLTRTQQRKRNDFIVAQHDFIRTHGREPSDADLVETGMDWDVVREGRLLLDCEAMNEISIDGAGLDALSSFSIDDLLDMLPDITEGMDLLEEEVFYKTEIMKMKNYEVAEQLNISPPRVSQIRKQAKISFIERYEAM